MILKCGIVGLPNVGKSTLFNALTSSSVKAENFPFCTIKANRGFISVVDERLFQLSEIAQIKNITHGTMEVIDIAGLIRGASQGEGLGNEFLSDVSKADILCHVVRCFDTLDVYHINHEINPEKDINIIHDELILSDIALCERIILLFEKRNLYNSTKDAIKILQILKRCLMNLNNGIMLRETTITLEEQKIVRKYNFLTFKPIVYVANIDGINSIDNRYLSKLSDIAISKNIPYCSIYFLCGGKFKEIKIDSKISFHIIFLKEFEGCSKFLDFINIVYQVLQLKTFFTANIKEVKAWIVSKRTVAIEAANMVHSDFRKNFIRVQVLSYNDFVTYGGWKESKKFGKIRVEGQKYLIQDGDILNFLI